MSVPYYSSDLPEMAESARAMLQKEQQTLWRMKHLLRGLRGDQTWIPCGRMRTEFDDWLLNGEQQVASAPPSRTSFVNGVNAADITTQIWGAAPNVHLQGGLEVVKIPSLERRTQQRDRQRDDTESAIQVDAANQAVPSEPMINGQDASLICPNGVIASTPDTLERDQEPQTNGIFHSLTHTEGASEGTVDQPQTNGVVQPATNALQATNGDAQTMLDAEEGVQVSPRSYPRQSDTLETLPFPPSTQLAEGSQQAQEQIEGDLMEDDDSSSVPASHRMTTRARANNDSTRSSPASPPSPSATADSVPPIHPFFKHPTTLDPLSNPALFPPTNLNPASAQAAQQMDDIRVYLLSYVSKQSEIVRSLEEMHKGLLKALRYRDRVLKWCKAEGHVGEMSDGEDWYDREEWGLDGDLGKGREEDEGDEGDAPRGARERRRGRRGAGEK